MVQAPEELSRERSEVCALLELPRAKGGAGLKLVSFGARADLTISLEARWTQGRNRSARAAPETIVWDEDFVPVSGFPGDRPDARLSDCLTGRERLERPEEVEPPLVARTVEGKTIDDTDYPLVREFSAKLLASGVRGMRARAESFAAMERIYVSRPGDQPNARGRIVWIVVAGDLMTSRGVDSRLSFSGPKSVFGAEVLNKLLRADIAAANLEGVLTRRGEPARKSYTFRSPPAVAGILAAAGFDALLLANNHSMDWGPLGLSDTLDALEKTGIAPVGAGKNLKEAFRPYLRRVGAQAFALWGIGTYPRERTGWDGSSAAAGEDRAGILRSESGGERRLEALFKGEQFNIVLFHGGMEWSAGPSPETKSFCRRLVDAGADVVIGSHPHVVQGMEWYKGKPIFWSLGNFVFPGMEGTPGGEDGLLLEIGLIEGRILYLRTVPLALSSQGVRIGGAGATLLASRSAPR